MKLKACDFDTMEKSESIKGRAGDTGREDDCVKLQRTASVILTQASRFNPSNSDKVRKFFNQWSTDLVIEKGLPAFARALEGLKASICLPGLLPKVSMADIDNERVTLCMIKPDGIVHADRILERIRNEGFEVLYKTEPLQVEQEVAEKLYAEHKGKQFQPGLVSYVTGKAKALPSDKVILLVLRGESGVCARLRDVIGEKDGSTKGSLRNELGVETIDGIQRNKIHGSSSFNEALREILIMAERYKKEFGVSVSKTVNAEEIKAQELIRNLKVAAKEAKDKNEELVVAFDTDIGNLKDYAGDLFEVLSELKDKEGLENLRIIADEGSLLPARLRTYLSESRKEDKKIRVITVAKAENAQKRIFASLEGRIQLVTVDDSRVLDVNGKILLHHIPVTEIVVRALRDKNLTKFIIELPEDATPLTGDEIRQKYKEEAEFIRKA